MTANTASPTLLSKGRKLVVIGLGAVGQACLQVFPQMLRNTAKSAFSDDTSDSLDWAGMILIDCNQDGKDFPVIKALIERGAQFLCEKFTAENYLHLLESLQLSRGDVLLELCYNLDDVSFTRWASKQGVIIVNSALYEWDTINKSTDTCSYDDAEELKSLLGETCNEIRGVMAINQSCDTSTLGINEPLPRDSPGGPGPTGVMIHGANPGLVSHFVKQALLDCASWYLKQDRSSGERQAIEKHLQSRDYAQLAQALEVRVVQVSEKDNQYAPNVTRDGPGHVVSTWNVDSFLEECAAPAELALGSHEGDLEKFGNVRPYFGGRPWLVSRARGLGLWTRTWIPDQGEVHGVTPRHEEAMTIADYLTVTQEDKTIQYRPTVYFSYRPLDLAVDSLKDFTDRQYAQQDSSTVLDYQIESGRDSLGALLAGPKIGCWWTGSLLSIVEARELAPHSSATSVQVGAGVAAAACWSMANPDQGVHFPETVPTEEILALAKPFLGTWFSGPSEWTPNDDKDYGLESFVAKMTVAERDLTAIE